MAMLNLNDKAFEYFKMINPIEHSKTKELANKYKVEPYVVAADIYGAGNLTGRGGWTWYTGSSSWMYVAGVEYILGIKISGDKLKIEPHVPTEWNEYSVRICIKESIYNIKVRKKEDEKTYIIVNGKKYMGNTIKIDNDSGSYNIEASIL